MQKTQSLLFAAVMLVSCLMITGCGSSQKKGKFSQEEMELLRYPTKTGLPQASGGFTVNVGDSSLSTKDVISSNSSHLARSAQAAGDYEQFRADSKPVVEAIIISKIADLLLYQEAQKSMPDNFNDEILEKAVEDEIRRFIASHNGNYSLAERSIKEMGMDWDSFRDYQKRMIVVQSYLASETGEIEPVTYDDILNYYNAQKLKRFSSKPSYQFRLIDINLDEVQVKETNDPNNAPSTKLETAVEMAEEIIEKLNSGQDFADLAKQYSHGFAADDGGLWEPVTKGALAPPYNVIESYIEDIQKGQTAGPIETSGHVFIVKLEFKTAGGIVPFTKVQQRLASELEFMRRKKMVDDMMMKFSKQVDLQSMEEFIESCLRQAYYQFN